MTKTRPAKIAGRIRWTLRLPVDGHRDRDGRTVTLYEVPYRGEASPESMARAIRHHLKQERFGLSYDVQVEVTKIDPRTDTMLVKTTETRHD